MLHLMRHGAPAVEGRLLGRTDDPATPAGIADGVARASGLTIERVVSSDLRRASASAEAIAAPRGLAVEIDPRWRELDFGEWDGVAPSSIDPIDFARFHDDPDGAAPPGGERWSSLRDRVSHALDAVPAEPTLVVTHGGPMRAALAIACGFDRRQVWAFDLPYTALLSLRLWPGEERFVQIVGLAT